MRRRGQIKSLLSKPLLEVQAVDALFQGYSKFKKRFGHELIVIAYDLVLHENTKEEQDEA